ncbi:MAG: hypothetical protein U1D55_04255 [Phycisphaerae bacterium]
MWIDTRALPTPDWDLLCPFCNYSLRGLPAHRCPECGHDFDPATLIQSWTRVRPPRFTGDERPLPDFGLACAQCRAPLAGAAADSCVCGQAFALRRWQPRGAWFLIDADFAKPLGLSAAEIVLSSEQVPYIPLNNRSLPEIVMGTSPLGARLLVPSEFYWDARYHLSAAARRAIEARSQARAEWRCPACGEDNPGHFEICWNCEAARPQP